MDGMCTTGAVARTLGTSAPRVIRAADRLWPGCHRPREHRRFTHQQVAALTAELGAAPLRLRVALNREELFVLTALSLRPLGLRSARAVAMVAGVSPTSASRALGRLRSLGLVYRSRTLVVEGRPRRVEPWHVDFLSPIWWDLAQAVYRVVLPSPKKSSTVTDKIPRRLWHHFWNAKPAELSTGRDGRYIAGRILQSDDAEAIAWVAAAVRPDDLRAASRLRSLDHSRQTLARNLAASR
ncbi:MAG: hypothetical protein ACRDV8_02495 [Acidimicrobiales bacterium]